MSPILIDGHEVKVGDIVKIRPTAYAVSDDLVGKEFQITELTDDNYPVYLNTGFDRDNPDSFYSTEDLEFVRSAFLPKFKKGDRVHNNARGLGTVISEETDRLPFIKYDNDKYNTVNRGGTLGYYTDEVNLDLVNADEPSAFTPSEKELKEKSLEEDNAYYFECLEEAAHDYLDNPDGAKLFEAVVTFLHRK